jgi:hypothetical protein
MYCISKTLACHARLGGSVGGLTALRIDTVVAGGIIGHLLVFNASTGVTW